LCRACALAILLAAAWSPLAAQTQEGTLVFAVESLSAQTMDPIQETRRGNAIYQAPVYDSLVGFDVANGGTGPGVAGRWELSEDGLAWTFHVRPGQRFHNGDKPTARDVKFSLQRQMAPNSTAAAAATMRRTTTSTPLIAMARTLWTAISI
jgi:peptide/nickel transport system substrate-binding protein